MTAQAESDAGVPTPRTDPSVVVDLGETPRGADPGPREVPDRSDLPDTLDVATAAAEGVTTAPSEWTVLEREALTFTAELIRIESVNTGEPDTIGDGEAQACAYIRERLEEAGYECDYVESVPGRGSLITRLRGTAADAADNALVLHAHVDVVPVQTEDWSVPPFSGEFRDGWLYGRGAVDMKNVDGQLLALARDLVRRGVQPTHDIIFAFFADEEANGVYGAHHLVDHHPELFAGATRALSEVGGFSLEIGGRRIYPVATAEKGVGWVRLTATGVAGHGSRPTGRNAVTTVARAMAALGEYEMPVRRTQAVALLLERVSEAVGEDLTALSDSALLALMDERPELFGHLGAVVRASLRDTISPTMLTAGYKANVIPASAVAEADCRILPGSEDSFADLVQSIVDDAVGEGVVTVEWTQWQDPIASDAEDELVDAMDAAIAEHDPGALVVPYLLPASTDNKHLAALGISGFGFAPLRVPADFDVFGHFHAADERVPVEAVAFGARVLDHMLRAGGFVVEDDEAA